VYPNPAVSNINLLTNVSKNVETLDVNIYNILGVSVLNTTIDSMGRLNDLDVSMLASGIYTVQVRMKTKDSEEILSVHKLIKK
jgi:galactitol-specific phosphotransferase system IIC component